MKKRGALSGPLFFVCCSSFWSSLAHWKENLLLSFDALLKASSHKKKAFEDPKKCVGSSALENY
jgi:hypothetical protein